MPRVVLSGGPGVGKTALLRVLAARGYAVVEESAREVIRERKRQGLPPRPNPQTFAREVLRRDRIKYQGVVDEAPWVFFDRSALEAMAMLAGAVPLAPSERSRLLAEFSYFKRVFVLPPWSDIYVQDSERDHAFGHCVKVHDEVVTWYRQLNYEVDTVPLCSPEQRADHVLQMLATHGDRRD